MNKRMTSWMVLAAWGLMTLACANPGSSPPSTTPPAGPGEARKFPEVEILTVEGDVLTAKLVRLESDGRIVALPSPYWGVETMTLATDQIRSVRRLDKPSPVSRWAMAGFALAAVIGGGWYLIWAQYDEDFSAGLLNTPIAGSSIGVPLGLVVGALSAAANPRKLDFRRMSEARRLAALRKWMGI